MRYERENARLAWTHEAIRCYASCCDCEHCTVFEVLGRRCQMQRTLLKLVRELGKPTEADYKRVRLEPYGQKQQPKET